MINIFLLIAIFLMPAPIFAETIVLKSGKILNQRIIERSEDYIKVDISGVPVALFMDEIESIDAEAVRPAAGNIYPEPGLSYGSAYEYYQAGLNALQTNQPQEAMLNFQEAIKLNPDYVQAYFHLSVALNVLDRPKDAIASLKKAINIKPNYAEAYLALGTLYANLGNKSEGVNNYDKAIKLFDSVNDRNSAAQVEALKGNLLKVKEK